jgi:hypothetical protein
MNDRDACERENKREERVERVERELRESWERVKRELRESWERVERRERQRVERERGDRELRGRVEIEREEERERRERERERLSREERGGVQSTMAEYHARQHAAGAQHAPSVGLDHRLLGQTLWTPVERHAVDGIHIENVVLLRCAQMVVASETQQMMWKHDKVCASSNRYALCTNGGVRTAALCANGNAANDCENMKRFAQLPALISRRISSRSVGWSNRPACEPVYTSAGTAAPTQALGKCEW